MFTLPAYSVPSGLLMGAVPVSRFTGEPATGPLAGNAGAVFFSPALPTASNVNRVDVAEVTVAAISSDAYSRPEERDGQVFTFSRTGPSRTNNALYRSQPREYGVTAVLVQTIPPGPTTIIKIP